MLSTIYLSLDSVFAGASLGFFGVPKRYWLFASSAIGFADAFALWCGWTLRNSIFMRVTPSQQGVLLVCSGLGAIIAGNLCAKHPRAFAVAIAFVFSLDNLVAGSQLAGIRSAAEATPTAAIVSGLACLAGLHLAEPIKRHVLRRDWFALAGLTVCIRFLAG